MKLQEARGIWKKLEGECQCGYDQNTLYACMKFSDNNDNNNKRIIETPGSESSSRAGLAEQKKEGKMSNTEHLCWESYLGWGDIPMHKVTPGCETQCCEKGTRSEGAGASRDHNNSAPMNMNTIIC